MKSIILVLICVLFTSSLSAQSLGAKLALVDTGKHYSETDPLSKRYNNIINQLADKYIESKERIADITVVGKKELENVGLSEPMINMMEGILKLRDVYTITKRYSENVSVYVIIRGRGRNHAEALAGQQSLLSQFSMETILKTATGQ